MIEVSFVESFFAEFVITIIFASFLFELMIRPGHAKSRLVNLIFLYPFYTKMISFNFVIDTAILSLFLIYGLLILIQTLKSKGRLLAIKEYEKRPLKPKYGLNDTIERINIFIYVALLACILVLISFFLGSQDIIFLIGIISLIITLIIMGNHFMNGNIKKSTQIDSKKIKVNLFTLFSLTSIFSILIFISLLFRVSSYFPTLLESFHFISFLVIVPILYVSNYLLDKSRLTFFKKKDIAKIFISNIFNYSIIFLAITIVLSDIPVALIVLKGQNIVLMNIWVNGFIIFISYTLIIIYKKSLLFGLESKTLKVEKLKSESLK